MSFKTRYRLVHDEEKGNDSAQGTSTIDQPQTIAQPQQLPITASIRIVPSTTQISQPAPAISPEIQTDKIAISHFPNTQRQGNTTGRMPTVIPGNNTRSLVTIKTSKQYKRSPLAHASIGVLIIAIVVGVLMAVIPVDGKGHSTGLSIFNPNVNMKQAKKNETALISAQAATATAVMQDGFGQPISVSIAPPDASKDFVPDASFDNRYLMGQCTYWADFRYHQLTHYAVPWMYDAKGWAYGASQSPGWVVSATPKVPSIMVLQPGVQGAGLLYGHVTIVESINADGTLHTSAWNVVGPGILTYVDYHITPGISFVWHV